MNTAKRRDVVEFLPLLAALAIACAVAILSIRDSINYGKWRNEAQRHDQVVEHANALLSELKDAETGQRGYLLTGKDSYLEPYRQSLSQIRADLSFLAHVSAQRDRVAALTAVVNEKLSELQRTIRLRQTGDLAAAISVVQSDEGKRLMDHIRADVGGIVAEATEAGVAAQENLRSSEANLRWVSTLGSIALVALLFVAQTGLWKASIRRLRLIEELHRSGEETAAARDMFQTTLQSIGDAVIATDAEGRITFINPVAQHLTGWTQQSAVGVPLHRVFRIMNENTRQSLDNPVEKVIQSGRIVGLANHTVLAALDGREIPIDDSAAPLRNANGSVQGTVLVFRDVTERRRAEVELRKGRSELERSNTALQQLNSDLELFAYAAGHDLQEPLRTIAAFSELIARRLEGNPDTVQHLRFIQAAVARMRAMIEGLLSYSRLMREGSLGRTEVRMDEVVGEALLNCETAIAESQAVIHTDVLPKVVANRQQMVQLFQNLIGNAVKYRSDKRPEIRISAASANGGGWVFSVGDNGMGFDMRYSEEIFQIFRRLQSGDHAGTGLGLAMCKRIVELHGGRIWAEAEPGCGSIFRFTIPASTGHDERQPM
ncbi:MAG: CHASE3 domain-containing protein [Acidobacteriaceae bacterium]|nr:CHASE3 domain-containing protein [Acidobacteriaceae bacterium]